MGVYVNVVLEYAIIMSHMYLGSVFDHVGGACPVLESSRSNSILKIRCKTVNRLAFNFKMS